MEILELKNTIFEMKNLPNGLNRRMDMVEESDSKFDNRSWIYTTYRTESKKYWKKWTGLKDLWSNVKGSNICVIRVSAGEEKKKGTRKKYIFRNNYCKLPKFSERHKFCRFKNFKKPS